MEKLPIGVGLLPSGKYKEAFLENPDNLPMVNHIDSDKTNNKLENLEWISCSDNNKHAWKAGSYKNSSRIIKS